MAAYVARPENINFFADGHFDFAFDHVGERFMLVNVQRGAYTGLIVNFEERHFLSFDERLDEEVAIHRLSLYRFDY
jgi:hypothetical protein